MTRPIPPQLRPFLEKWEGRKRKVYLDSKGVPTVGIGHTGPEVKVGDTWTDGQIEAAYEEDALEAAMLIPLSQSVIDALPEERYAALISFVFNVGPRPKATLWKRIKEGNLGAVPSELAKWNKITLGDGSVRTLPGLVNRRAAEAALWMEASPHADMTSLRTSSPDVEVVPTFADPRPPSRSAQFITAVVSPFAAVGAAVAALVQALPDWAKQIINVINPFSGQSEFVQNAVAGLATVAAGGAALNLVFTLLKKRETRN
jgi:lysozyme